MALEYNLDVRLRTFFSKHTGQLGLNEMSSLHRSTTLLPDFQPGMIICRDTRGAIFPEEWGFNFFNKDITEEIHKIFLDLGECKLAWIVDKGHQYRVAHQSTLRNRLTHYDMVERKIFTDPQLAYRWLGLPENLVISFTDPS